MQRSSRWGGCRLAASAAASPGRLCPWCRDSWTGAASVGPDRCWGPWSLFSSAQLLSMLHVTTSHAVNARSSFLVTSIALSVTNFKCHSPCDIRPCPLYSAHISAVPVQCCGKIWLKARCYWKREKIKPLPQFKYVYISDSVSPKETPSPLFYLISRWWNIFRKNEIPLAFNKCWSQNF